MSKGKCMSEEKRDIVKRRMLVLTNFLYEHTDDEHQITSDELVAYLKE